MKQKYLIQIRNTNYSILKNWVFLPNHGDWDSQDIAADYEPMGSETYKSAYAIYLDQLKNLLSLVEHIHDIFPDADHEHVDLRLVSAVKLSDPLKKAWIPKETFESRSVST